MCVNNNNYSSIFVYVSICVRVCIMLVVVCFLCNVYVVHQWVLGGCRCLCVLMYVRVEWRWCVFVVVCVCVDVVYLLC